MTTLADRGPMTIVHPGRPLERRSVSIAVDASPAVRYHLPPGDDLFSTVHAELDRSGAAGAAFILLAGEIERLTIMTGGQGADGLPVGFRGPHRLAAPLKVVTGAGATGCDENGERVSHCHAVFRDVRRRQVGGHLIIGETIAGSDGLVLDLVVYRHGRFVRRVDPETLFSIFHPVKA